MKREILCNPCGLKSGTVRMDRTVSALDAAMMAQEKTVKVYGTLLRSVYCDACMAELHKGDNACCLSIAGMGQHYYPWEDEYVLKEERC